MANGLPGAERPLRVLFVVPYTPNLVRVRPYNLIRALAANGHAVTVLTLFEHAKEEADAAALAAEGLDVIALPLARWRKLVNCLAVMPRRGTPLQVAYCWHPAGAAALAGALVDDQGRPAFDVVHVEHLRGARYALHALRHRPVTTPIIWDSVDNISLLFRLASQSSVSRFGRWMTRFEQGRTERYEAWVGPQFDRVLVTSRRDKEALVALTGGNGHNGHTSPADNVVVLPNGVDLDYFRPPAHDTRAPATLVVTGKMSYHANVTMVLHLAEQILPLIWARRPDVQLQIVGKDPGRAIQALADHPNIHVTGTVPDMRPYLQQATAAVAPLTYGVGIQNKVLEAMACGTPVVTTSRAAASFDAAPGRDLQVADTPEAFAAASLALLDDLDARRAMGRGGRAYVETHHNWQTIVGDLAAHYRSAIAARAGAPV